MFIKRYCFVEVYNYSSIYYLVMITWLYASSRGYLSEYYKLISVIETVYIKEIQIIWKSDDDDDVGDERGYFVVTIWFEIVSSNHFCVS